MEWVLIVITFAALAVAGALGAVVWQMKRDDQARAEARVAALTVDIEGAPTTADAFDWPPPPGDAGEIDAPVPFEAGLFQASVDDERANRSLGPAVAAAALVLAGLVGAVLFIGSGTGSSASTVAAGREAPLELLSLRHERRDDQLTVTGFARNPAQGLPVERLTAVVFFFDQRGEFLASGRAPLDFTRLGPGDESPFTVTATVPGTVRRYRVSFRRDTGGVAPHVDRRGRN